MSSSLLGRMSHSNVLRRTGDPYRIVPPAQGENCVDSPMRLKTRKECFFFFFCSEEMTDHQWRHSTRNSKWLPQQLIAQLTWSLPYISLQEKVRGQYMPLYKVFVDISKAFDSIKRQALWIVPVKYGSACNLIAMLRRLSSSCNKDFTMTWMSNCHLQSVKQGCVFPPTLFTLYLTTIVEIFTGEVTEGILYVQ